MEGHLSSKAAAAWGSAVGAILAVPLLVLIVLGDSVAGLAHVPFDVFAWLTRILPGQIVTFGIDTMVDLLMLLGLDVSKTAKSAEHVMAYALSFGALVVVAALFFAATASLDRARSVVAGSAVGLALASAAALLGITLYTTATAPALLWVPWVLVVFTAWGASLGWARGRFLPESGVQAADSFSVDQLDRRRFLIRLGGASAVVTVSGVGLDLLAARSESSTRERVSSRGPETLGAPATGDGASERDLGFELAPGTRSELTAVEDHYLIDINPRPPAVDEETWRLRFTGLVDSPQELSLAEIKGYPKIERYITLSCISNRLGGDLIGTTKWTGVSLQQVLADVGLREQATHLEIRSVDGFHESLALELVDSDPRIMLVYAWDDEPLTRAHGAPLRIWIPDRYGMKQPRWIQEIEATDEFRAGYWVERGWNRDAIVRTTSVIDTVAEPVVDPDAVSKVPIGGIAYAGARGISRVEVRIDGGEWLNAMLREPLSDTTWVLWRYDWPFEEGEHLFEVRCYEADGTRQIEQEMAHRPSGATGVHSVRETL